MKLVWVLIGGSLGAACRYGVNLWAARTWGAGFPYGTLVVNLAGCLLIGLAFGLSERANLLGPNVRLFFITGFLGALTTFSSYAVETVNAARAGALLIAGLNLLFNNLIGFALVVAGMVLSRLMV